MRFYRVSEDWITYLDGEFRASILDTLRSLPATRLQKYPPPKLNGLPFGNETRVLSRFLKGQSSQLDPSALSGFYRSFQSPEDKLIYRAFRQNEPVTRAEWTELIGENVDQWLANKCLFETSDGLLKCLFSVVSLDGLIIAVDPLNDHGNTAEAEFVMEENVPDDDDVQPFYHTYIGLDSLQMIETMAANPLPSTGRFLDCGPGSGSILLYFARKYNEAVGIDINARAAKLAQFNADLNKIGQCKAYTDDAIASGGRYGKFDLVSWNLPFIFMPDEHKDDFIDGFGGEMGIGLCLQFLDTIPEILAEGGAACVAALSPILETGENILEERLKQKLGRLGLDCTIQITQISLAHTRDLWQFHQSHGIRKFESVYLHLRHGTGQMVRVEAPATRKIVDVFREKFYQRKFA
jgi:methylase of polypeptide subunit release factors